MKRAITILIILIIMSMMNACGSDVINEIYNRHAVGLR